MVAVVVGLVFVSHFNKNAVIWGTVVPVCGDLSSYNIIVPTMGYAVCDWLPNQGHRPWWQVRQA